MVVDLLERIFLFGVSYDSLLVTMDHWVCVPSIRQSWTQRNAANTAVVLWRATQQLIGPERGQRTDRAPPLKARVGWFPLL